MQVIFLIIPRQSIKFFWCGYRFEPSMIEFALDFKNVAALRQSARNEVTII